MQNVDLNEVEFTQSDYNFLDATERLQLNPAVAYNHPEDIIEENPGSCGIPACFAESRNIHPASEAVEPRQPAAPLVQEVRPMVRAPKRKTPLKTCQEGEGSGSDFQDEGVNRRGPKKNKNAAGEVRKRRGPVKKKIPGSKPRARINPSQTREKTPERSTDDAQNDPPTTDASAEVRERTPQTGPQHSSAERIALIARVVDIGYAMWTSILATLDKLD